MSSEQTASNASSEQTPRLFTWEITDDEMSKNPMAFSVLAHSLDAARELLRKRHSKQQEEIDEIIKNLPSPDEGDIRCRWSPRKRAECEYFHTRKDEDEYYRKIAFPFSSPHLDEDAMKYVNENEPDFVLPVGGVLAMSGLMD